MNYWEALIATVSKAEAKQEIERHACDFDEFLQEVGDREEYEGSEILDWLGY